MGFEDTAGVRDVKSSQIEAEGIEMAKEAAASADLCIDVFDDLRGQLVSADILHTDQLERL